MFRSGIRFRISSVSWQRAFNVLKFIRLRYSQHVNNRLIILLYLSYNLRKSFLSIRGAEN